MAGDFRNVEAAKASHTSVSVGRCGARQPGQDSEGFFKLADEHVGVNSVFEPPLFSHVGRVCVPSSSIGLCGDSTRPELLEDLLGINKATSGDIGVGLT